MSALTTTWAQAVIQVLLTSDKEWLSPHDILHEIKCQRIKEICSSNPICSVKKILYKSDGPFLWDKVNHLFALKRRVGDVEVNGQPETPQVDRIKVERKIVKEEKKTVEAASKDGTQADKKLSHKEKPPQEEKLPQEDKPLQEKKPPKEDNCTGGPQCYNSPLGYVVTISPPLADGNNAAKNNNRSPPKLSLSPIRHAFTKRLLQSSTVRTRPHKSKAVKSSPIDKEGRTAVAAMEYDRLFEATGGTFVALLANQVLPHIVDTFVYDPSQSEECSEPHPPSDSKGMEEGSKGGSEEGENRSDKAVKKTPPSVAKLKRTRKINDDSNLASVNIRSSLTMENFNKLTKENKQKVINLLPVIDRCDEYTPTSSAFNNTFFNSACRQWQQLLQSGQLSISQRAKQKLEDTSRNKMVDEWKQKHFEEELSKDTPPQDPRSKLFYPVPLNSTHQRVLDCIKRVVCESSQDDDNNLSVASINEEEEEEEEETPDVLSEENKTLNCGSPEQCNVSHETTNDEPHDEPSEKNHQQNLLQPQLIDSQVNHKLSLELNNKLPDKNNIPQSPEISEPISNTTPKKNTELSVQTKSSPGTPSPSINNKLFGRSPEQVDRSHDSACESPVDSKDKGKQLEQDGKLMPRSLEQDIEKASMSLKLQINKLCQEQLYKKLELLNKSAEQQAAANKLLEAVMTTNEDKPCGMNNSCKRSNLSTRYKKKANNKPCIKLSVNRTLPVPLSKCSSSSNSSINLCLTNNTPSLTKNRISFPSYSWLKSPSLFGFNTPLKYEAGLKRKLPPTVHSPTNVKKSCDDTRGDFLTTLPAAFMYSDIVAELKRRSIGHFFPTPSSYREPRKDWQSVHSIYHDHSYATDYVPINSTTSEEQSDTTCDGCAGMPLLMCLNCNRCFHDWCMMQGCQCCEECRNADGMLPLV